MEPVSGGYQLPSSPSVGAAVSFETLGLLWDAGVPWPSSRWWVSTVPRTQETASSEAHRLDHGAQAEPVTVT